MPLAAGQSLSYYEILGPLGVGAMGEVYRAMDTRLEREVAIKVLPEHFAQDEERLRRFEREAKSLASLNHSNVAQIFGVDQAGDTCFLVLELVPGETLEDRIARGPLSVDDAIDVCGQIAEGLEAAHDAGVIHRDLKPANVRITPEGEVKVLDFGLAKSTGPNADSRSTTDSVLATEEGRLLGTPTYMAPEQARGKPIDRRVDVWAFGCVLYECLTAKRAFPGENFSDVVVSIMSAEPDWAALPAGTPARVEGLLRRCFDRDKRTRLRDVGEARITLAGAPEDPAPGRRARGPARLPWMVALVSLVVAAVAIGKLLRTPPVAPATNDARALEQRAVQEEHRRILAHGGGISQPCLSPTGEHVAFLRDGAIEVRAARNLQTTHLSGTEGAMDLFWRPDGTEIGFARNRPGGGFTLHTIAIGGGKAFDVTEITGTAVYLGGVWTIQDEILFAVSGSEEVRGLHAVPASGGGPSTLVLAPDQDRGEFDFHGPYLLSDGFTVTMTLHAMRDATEGILIWDGGETRLLLEAGSDHRLMSAVNSPGSDQLLFERRGSNEGIWVVPFSLDEGVLRGTPEPLVPGGRQLSIDAKGQLAYLGGVVREDPRVRRVDVHGEPVGEAVSPGLEDLRMLAVSPDGRRVAAMVEVENDRDVWVYSLDGPTRTRLTRADGYDGYPVWARDGRTVFFARDGGVHSVAADGESEPTSLQIEGFPRDVSPDGRWLVLENRNLRDVADIRLAEIRDGRPAEVRDLVATDADESAPAFSPGGDLLAYTTDATGRSEVVVKPFSDTGSVGSGVQISIAGGSHPRWAPAGKRLFFIAQDEGRPVLMGVEVTMVGERVEVVGAPVVVFTGATARSNLVEFGARHYDVLGDGSEFLVVEEFVSGTPEVVLWSGWADLSGN